MNAYVRWQGEQVAAEGNAQMTRSGRFRSSWRVIRLAALAALAPVLSAAFPAQSTATPVGGAPGRAIHACYNKRTGALRLLTKGSCRGGETPIAWNLTGVAGPGGAVGPPGPKGSSGSPGSNGAPGHQGAQGAMGLAGANGPTGPEGVTGATGPAGPAGASPAGPTGEGGPTGPMGAAGATGATGKTGATGEAGAAGAKGPSGPTGAVGATGAGGPGGPAGATGATGALGAPGPGGRPGPALPAAEPGRVETGVWSATPAHIPKETFFTIGTISLPVAMAFAITGEEDIVIMNKAQSAVAPASRTGTPLENTLAHAKEHCTGTLEAPSATPAGWVCIYTGVELLEEETVTGVVNLEGSAGLGRTGGRIEFLASSEPKLDMQGTWAVAES